MKVILLSDVKKVGKKGEVVDVADGYGRNYLIRNKLAVLATNKSMEVLSEQKAQDAQTEKEKEQEAKEVAKKLESITLVFDVKTGKEGKVFGSVSTKHIVEELNKQYGISVDKRKIIDNGPVGTLGINNVRVELYKNVEGTIKVHLKAIE